MSNSQTNSKRIEAKAVPTGKPNEWIVIRSYIHPLLGPCHVDYKTVFAATEAQAIAEAA